ncbi:MAG: mechanosensitive ion channel [Desulfofustis sp.]|nr:mechanosensitive ion channel [Desulfofustis sp.]MBT8353071.1 mechanosensitive ion channel [Desulfofustis sp.]NNF46509.1 mechanosensitive ion channel [Desulfofustis sp.]NNK58236.1 mechanosensitive ion channel [Desulfofustis sp.]RZW27402.1 MAG: mechanosensitive ion channel [Desulfobulbaceae bacterium]
MENLIASEVLMTWGLRIAAALAILVIGNWLAKKFTSVFVKMMERNDIDVTLTKFLKNIVYYALLTAVVIAAAQKLGINTGSFLAVVGAAGLAIGLALKDSLANFSAGVMLILFRPFKVGDAVTVAGETGAVEEITIFNTVMNTPDNQRKIIPNGLITSGTITNITANDTRRIDMVFGIGYEDDIKSAEQVFTEMIKAEPRVLSDPAPTIAVAELADSSVNFVVRPWVRTVDYWNVKFELTEKIKLALDEAGISIPFPQQDVHMHQVVQDGEAEAA